MEMSGLTELLLNRGAGPTPYATSDFQQIRLSLVMPSIAELLSLRCGGVAYTFHPMGAGFSQAYDQGR